MSESFDPNRSLTTLEQDSTVIAVIEMSQSKWLVAAVIPGVERQPLKKLDADEEALLKLLTPSRLARNTPDRERHRFRQAVDAQFARWVMLHVQPDSRSAPARAY
jgi:hypothetical protein